MKVIKSKSGMEITLNPFDIFITRLCIFVLLVSIVDFIFSVMWGPKVFGIDIFAIQFISALLFAYTPQSKENHVTIEVKRGRYIELES